MNGTSPRSAAFCLMGPDTVELFRSGFRIGRLVDAIAKGQSDPAYLDPRSTERNEERKQGAAELIAEPRGGPRRSPGNAEEYRRSRYLRRKDNLEIDVDPN